MPPARDLTGRRFGRLEVLARAPQPGASFVLWVCACDCGNQTAVRASNLVCGRSRSCGCGKALARERRNADNFRDLTDRQFGRLTVEDIAFRRREWGGVVYYWRCRCECGAEMIINGKSLKSGVTRSCGCLQRELAGKRRRRRFKTYEVEGLYFRAVSPAMARRAARRKLAEMGLPVSRQVVARLYNPASDPELEGFVRRAA